MGIFKKFADLARANLNALLDQAEDPQKMADLAIIELEASKKKAQRLLVSAMASVKLAERHRLQLRSKVELLKEKAERFLCEGDEATAKEALFEKQTLNQEQQHYDEQIEHERRAIETINRGLSAIDQKIASIKGSAGKASSGFYASDKEDAFETFSRMEEKIDRAESEVEALNELLASEDKKDVAVQTPATSFDQNSDPDALERELAALKKKLND